MHIDSVRIFSKHAPYPPHRRTIWLLRWNSKTSYGWDMTHCEGELELTGCNAPCLNDSVACPSDKPLVSRFNSNILYPTKISRNGTRPKQWRCLLRGWVHSRNHRPAQGEGTTKLRFSARSEIKWGIQLRWTFNHLPTQLFNLPNTPYGLTYCWMHLAIEFCQPLLARALRCPSFNQLSVTY